MSNKYHFLNMNNRKKLPISPTSSTIGLNKPDRSEKTTPVDDPRRLAVHLSGESDLVSFDQLDGALLDWAAAKAAGIELYVCSDGHMCTTTNISFPDPRSRAPTKSLAAITSEKWEPSKNRLQALYLQEEFLLHLYPAEFGGWQSRGPSGTYAYRTWANAASPSVAISRSLVRWKLGDDISIPKQLIQITAENNHLDEPSEQATPGMA